MSAVGYYEVPVLCVNASSSPAQGQDRDPIFNIDFLFFLNMNESQTLNRFKSIDTYSFCNGLHQIVFPAMINKNDVNYIKYHVENLC